MLKLFNQKCLALHPLKNHLIRPGFIGAQFAAHSTSTAATRKPFHMWTQQEKTQEKIRKVEEKFGISWKSTCLPLSPEISRKIDSDYDLRFDISGLWMFVDLKYPDDVNQLVPSSDISLSTLFGTGGYLVRNNGDRVDLNADTFKGKFVFVCCSLVPPSLECRCVMNVCDELYSTRDDVEVVMAAWINTAIDGDDQKQIFDHFFSGFPKSCLAVPFEDSKQRAYVCKLVTDYTSSNLIYNPCLVLDTEGTVLPPFKSWAISSYGTAAFPFTEEIVEDIKARDEQLKKSSSLEQLLLVNGSSPDVVYRFNPEGGPREEVRISELNNKLVGVYVPGRSGDLFRTLLDMYEQCVKKQLEFEIVVAYSEHSSDIHGHKLHDLKLYQEKIDMLMLQKPDICRQWWCLLCDNSVSARLDRLIQGNPRKNSSDKLCVVGPAGGFIDVYAPGAVMKMYGVDGYPFTRATIIQKEASRMREITLESVLLGDDLFRGTDRDDATSAKKLLGRNVSVYFGCLYYMWDHKKVLSSYHEMKAKDPGFEVVFVYLKNDEDSVELVSKTTSAMPWYVCSFDLDRLESVRETLGFGDKHAIVGFGEDGRVRSCRRAKSAAAFTLDDTLYEDVNKRRKDLPWCDRKDRTYDSDSD